MVVWQIQLLLVWTLFTINAHATSYSLVPAGLRLEGVGGIYGLAAGAHKITGERLTLVGGATAGEVQAAGIAILDVPLGADWIGLDAGFLHLARAKFRTSYERGFEEEGIDFGQSVSGQAYGAILHFKLDPKWVVSGGLAFSEFNLDSYSLNGHEIQRPSTAGFHPIHTASKIVRISYVDKTAPRRIKADVGATTAEGRAGQSDTLVASYSLAGYLPVERSLTLAAYAQWSDAYVTKKQTDYLDSTAVKSALNTRCSQLLNSEERMDCQRLEDSVASYVASNNQYGTAPPLGGNRGLRAYDELSVRAAHSRLLSLETRWDISKWLLPSSFK